MRADITRTYTVRCFI